jgi:hypothetical protein
MQVAVLLSSKRLSREVVDFMVAAWYLQALDFCEIWGIDPVAVAFYSDVTKLPGGDIWICDLVDDLDEPGASAYHSIVGDRPYMKLQVNGVAETSIEGSHEIVETLLDRTCDRWVPKGDGTQIAAESADPVQGDSYPIMATVMGETRQVLVSNFVTPPYFDRTQHGPTNKMGLPLEPFGVRPGGYQVVLGRDGNERQVFGRLRYGESGQARAVVAAKLQRGGGRLVRRLQGTQTA